jgi:hypothetical protein
MLNRKYLDKVSVDVFERDRHFFASVDFANKQHALGPATTRDEIYQLVFSFVSDLKLMTEINAKE